MLKNYTKEKNMHARLKKLNKIVQNFLSKSRSYKKPDNLPEAQEPSTHSISLDLKDTSDLIYFEEYWGIHGTSENQFVGLIKSKKYQTNRSLREISQSTKNGFIYHDDVVVLAGAWIARDKTRNFLSIESVGAIEGYGPTLYVTILQMAFDDSYAGVSPTIIPGKVTARASRIWKQFSTRYAGIISFEDRSGPQHKDSWLNYIYSLEKSLINLKEMRGRYRLYLNLGNGRQTPRNDVFEMAKKGGEEHRKMQDS